MITQVKSVDIGNGYRCEIHYMEHAEPYDCGYLGEIAYLKKSSYCLGTEQVDEDRMVEIRDAIAEGRYIGIPVFAYVHSGVTIRAGSGFSCQWDSGQSGYVYVDREDPEVKYYRDDEHVLEALRWLVKVTDDYLTGSVYGYRVIDPDGEEIDSRWGFYGDDEFDYMVEQAAVVARHEIDRLAKEAKERDLRDAKEATERQYWEARDVVTRP